MNLDRFTNSNGENLIKNLAEDGSEMVFIKVSPDGASFATRLYKGDDSLDVYVHRDGSVGCDEVSEMELRNLDETINPLDIVVSLHWATSAWSIRRKSRTIRVVTGIDLAGGSSERKRFMANRKNALREEMGGENRSWADFAFACATSSDTVPAPMVDAFDRLGFATEAMTLDEWVKLAKANAPATKKKAERNIDLSRFQLTNIADGAVSSLTDIGDGSILVGLDMVEFPQVKQDGSREVWAEFFASRFPNADVYLFSVEGLRGRDALVASEYAELNDRGIRFASVGDSNTLKKYAKGKSKAMDEAMANTVMLGVDDFVAHFPFHTLSTRSMFAGCGLELTPVVELLATKVGVEVKDGAETVFVPSLSGYRSSVVSEAIAKLYPSFAAFHDAYLDMAYLNNHRNLSHPFHVIQSVLLSEKDGTTNATDKVWESAAWGFVSAFVTLFEEKLARREQGEKNGEGDNVAK